ncbi:hypothetical protein STEG23_037319, partial [Scotinomys teguina]
YDINVEGPKSQCLSNWRDTSDDRDIHMLNCKFTSLLRTGFELHSQQSTTYGAISGYSDLLFLVCTQLILRSNVIDICLPQD